MCKVTSLYFDKAFESVLQLAVPCNVALVLFTFAANGNDEGEPAAGAVTALVWAFLGYSVAGLCAHFALVAALVASNGSLARIKVQGRREAFVVARAVHSMVKAEAPGLSPEAVLLEGAARRGLWVGFREQLHVAASTSGLATGCAAVGRGLRAARTACAYALCCAWASALGCSGGGAAAGRAAPPSASSSPFSSSSSSSSAAAAGKNNAPESNLEMSAAGPGTGI